MLASRKNLPAIKEHLAKTGWYSLDTETTGLNMYGEDTVFSIAISTGQEEYYFNTLVITGLPEEYTLEACEIADCLDPALSNPASGWYMHNAKFDMAGIAKMGLFIAGSVHCTQAIARLDYNEHIRYDLDSCASRIGLKKSGDVKEYATENDLWEWEVSKGKKSRRKRYFFDRVPIEVIRPYAENDARITFSLGETQRQAFCSGEEEVGSERRTHSAVYLNELRLTKACFRMERRGIQTDRAFCLRGFEHEQNRYKQCAEQFKQSTGVDFKDSNKILNTAFTQAGSAVKTTEKGNPSFTDDNLQRIGGPLAHLVSEYRSGYKSAHTYYQNFLELSDDCDSLHADIRQGGTATGRFSYSNPNLQNLTKEEDTSQEFLVRRCFVPREGYTFVMIDYDQMEYRMMLDYAGEMALIKKVLEGLDVHEATAQLMKVSRTVAKTINFMLLYGGGAGKLAVALKISENEAKQLKNQYFAALPKVANFIYDVNNTAARHGRIINWMGRVSYFPDANFAYKAPNYMIQGGCADVVKVAMVKLDEYLKDFQSSMLVQVHDEILFEVHSTEVHIIPELKRIMENVYPRKHLPLTCSIEISSRSWADKEEYVAKT